MKEIKFSTALSHTAPKEEQINAGARKSATNRDNVTGSAAPFNAPAPPSSISTKERT